MSVAAAPGTLGRPLIVPTQLPVRWLLPSIGALLGALLLGVVVGPGGLPWAAVLGALVDRLPFVTVDHGLTALQADVLFAIRLPRVVLGGLVGAMLASGGAAYQGVFRNPLADPYLLGVAAGAGLGATMAIAYGPGTSGWFIDPLPMFAFGGAVLAVAATYVLGSAGSTQRSVASIVLAGVAVAAFFTAAQTFVQQRNSDSIRLVYSWLLGGLNTAGWHQVLLIAPYVALSMAVLILHRRALDVLRVGEMEAASLGLRAEQVRLVVVLAATLGTAAAVSVSGLIGFVGIIVPHTVRLTVGGSYRRVLPLSMVLGAAFLIATDVMARTVSAPAEIPIGVITAFVGAPFFVVVLRRSGRGHSAT
jgi:iron complex transport system permease protein